MQDKQPQARPSAIVDPSRVTVYFVQGIEVPRALYLRLVAQTGRRRTTR